MAERLEPEFGLVMPFVACQSHGGAYEDVAFVAGYRTGMIDAALAAGPALHEAYAEPSLEGQLDLLAMRHGYTLTIEPWDDDPACWVLATFRQVPGA